MTDNGLRAALVRDLDDQLRGTEDWAEYTEDTVPVGLLRRLRAALAKEATDAK